MLNFLHRSGMRSPSPAILRALEANSLPSGTDASTLGVVESPGRYAGRKVTNFRVFDPARAAERAVDVFTNYTYQDLNAHLDLVLTSGFIEQDGAVVMYSRSSAPGVAAPSRVPAEHASPGMARKGSAAKEA